VGTHMIYSAIVFLPGFGALIAGLFGRWLGARPCELITTGLLIVSCALSWFVFWRVGFGHETAHVAVERWITSGELDVAWAFRIDTLTAVMFVVVTTVSALVHVYSIGYMSEDPGRPRFFSFLSGFTFAMLMLVTSDNLVQLFFGWEGVGLFSYLLIGFWYKKPEANAAAIKAFVVNRVGDFGFALGIFGAFAVFQTVDLQKIFDAAPGLAGQTFAFLGYEVDILTTLCLLLFMGAMGKSAQFLLHTWLPDAMEGPTPVSALIHAATMVTAGVFMVARLSPVFDQAPIALEFVTLIGSVTAFFAATVALTQNDIKRVVAYSTCSQLGYMFAACGIGAYSMGIFHLFTHAFFKGLLFLCAGSVIHGLHGEQDMRKMGGLAPKMRITWLMMIAGSLALAGFGIPQIGGFAGFYSKDAIIEASYAAETANQYAYWLLLFSAFLTAFYSWRLLLMTFHGAPRMSEHDYEHAHESPPVMTVPLLVLGLGAAFAGVLGAYAFIGDGANAFWGASVVQAKEVELYHAMHHELPDWVHWSTFTAMAVGTLLAFVYYKLAPSLPALTARAFKPIYLFLLNKWYFDELYDRIFVRPTFWLANVLWKMGDIGIINGLIDGTAAAVYRVTARTVRLQTGYIYHYAFAMLVGLALLVTWFMFNGGAT
jgi:NADH-quinone oxidoreductase subunit L